MSTSLPLNRPLYSISSLSLGSNLYHDLPTKIRVANELRYDGIEIFSEYCSTLSRMVYSEQDQRQSRILRLLLPKYGPANMHHYSPLFPRVKIRILNENVRGPYLDYANPYHSKSQYSNHSAPLRTLRHTNPSFMLLMTRRDGWL